MHHRLQYLPDYFLTMFHFNLAVVAVARYINNDANILFLNPEIHEFWARTVFLFLHIFHEALQERLQSIN